jgi:hypothetical protein
LWTAGNPGKKRVAMGAGGVVKMQKQRDFQGEVGSSKNGGLALRVEKCEFPREKRDRYGFTPLKRPGFLLKRSEMRFKLSETMRQSAETTHKTPIAP